MTHATDPIQAPKDQSEGVPSATRATVFFLIMAFIYLGPAPGMLFGQHSPWLREWTMFSGVGAGIPDGTFTVTHADGTTDRVSPLDAAGLERYPIMAPYLFEGRLYHESDFGRYAQALCSEIPETSDVTFDGRVGTPDGWRPVQVTDICAEAESGQ